MPHAPSEPSSVATKASRVLKYLLSGQSVDLDGHTVVADEEGNLCIEATSYRRDDEGRLVPSGTRLLRHDMTMSQFVAACGRLDDATLFMMGANQVLQEHHRRN